MCDITAGRVEYIRCDAVTIHVVNVRYLSLLRPSKSFETDFSMEYNTNSMSYIITNMIMKKNSIIDMMDHDRYTTDKQELIIISMTTDLILT